jgi:hypothetical protein
VFLCRGENELAEALIQWIVDPDLDLIKVYRLSDGRYARVAVSLTEIFAER